MGIYKGEIKQFLAMPEVQEHLGNEDMNSVFVSFKEYLSSNYRPLRKYFNEIGIEPTDYLTVLPYCYYYYELFDSPLYIVPANIKELITGSFYRVRNLKKVIIPKSVECIHVGAFMECQGLEEIQYEGTIEEFNKICNAEVSDTAVKIICTDGTFYNN